MSNKMLIDASHPEETRVVVVRGNRIEEFDFESEHKKLLKGNIYLARVTRVEPSLQAAFVEYGGNRHGFLAFSEIHPDYYQIPVADRQALLEEEEKAALVDDEDEQENEKTSRNNRRKKVKPAEAEIESDIIVDSGDEIDDIEQAAGEDTEDSVELVGAEDALEEVPARERAPRRQYKIQEVIKRRQILLVQVVKEERGNKGAAMTTYLSLAGRYSVLMPNTARGGGISRKITNVQDRKRLKDVVKDLHVPKGMGVILRTAGANRTKAEIKRDYEYLMRLWENVRALTLESVAPCLVYEEGSLIKRSIRDLYNKDISEILVSGEHGYREAKDFMRMLMPSHAKVVQPYREQLPIFAHNGIEAQLDAMLQPEVTLKSGGYLVINQTEALVAIDVNSGRSTKEHSIEETACQTNLEAAEEVARQLRLRDLAGLVVIDFIDMEEKRNNRLVEKKLKDCLKDDRARIQVGRISHFGLMEMSRQRIRASVLESTMQPCPHCNGTGYIRSDSSLALHVLRSIEEYLLRNPHFNITVRTSVATALYVLNHKRQALSDLEHRFGLTINIEADDEVGAQNLAIYKGTAAEGTPAVIPQLPLDDDSEDEIIVEEDTSEPDNETKDDNNNDNNQRRKRRNRGKSNDRNEEKAQRTRNEDDVVRSEDDNRRRRRRGRRGGRRYRDGDFERRRIPYAEPVGEFAERALAEVIAARRQRRVPAAEPVGFSATEIAIKVTPVVAKEQSVPEIPAEQPKIAQKDNKDQKDQEETAKPRKRRTKKTPVEAGETAAEKNSETKSQTNEADETPKRSSRGRKRKTKTAETVVAVSNDDATTPLETTKEPVPPEEVEKPAKKTTRRSRKAKVEEKSDGTASEAETLEAEKPAKKSRRKTTRSKNKTDENEKTVSSEPVVTSSDENEEDKPKRVGWWQRKGFF